MTASSPALSDIRRLDRAIGGVHGFIYFHPEAASAYEAIGLHGRSGYFASRSAPFGEATAEQVIDTFYNFHPDLVRSVIPAAWTAASPVDVQNARFAAAGAALDALGPVIDSDQVAKATTSLRVVINALDMAGRPLAEANADVALPGDPLVDLWQLATVVREWRGDAHIQVLRERDVSPLECLVRHVSIGAFPRAVGQTTRQWDDSSWDAMVADLTERGLVDETGAATEAGLAEREDIEVATDRLSAPTWQVLGDDERAELAETLRVLRRAIWSDETLTKAMGTTLGN